MFTEIPADALKGFIREVSESKASSISKTPLFKQATTIIHNQIHAVVGDTTKRNNIVKTLNAAIAAIPDLASGDALKTVGAILDISSSVAVMAGPVGVVVGVLLSLVSSILGFFQNDKADPPIYVVMTRVMREYRREELADKAAGVANDLRAAMVEMNAYDTFKISKEQARTLDTSVPNRIALTYLGELYNNLKRNVSRAKSLKEATEVLDDLATYCSLSIFRDLVVKRKWSLIHLSRLMKGKQAGQNDNVVDQQPQTIELDFLRSPPTIDEALVASVYDPAKWQMIPVFMKMHNYPDPPQPMPNQQEMRTISLGKSNWLTIPNPFNAENKKKPTVQFIKIGHYWLLRCPVYTQGASVNLFVRQPDSSSGECFERSDLPVSDFVKDKVTDFNSINVTFTQDNKCVLAPRCSPHRFFKITDGIIHDYLAMTEDEGAISEKGCNWLFKGDQ